MCTMLIIQEVFFNILLSFHSISLRQNFHFILNFSKNYRIKTYREVLRAFPQDVPYHYHQNAKLEIKMENIWYHSFH